jgi:hypothetical protein
MNDRTDIERVLETWFDDGPTAMPDRVSVTVADRIARQPQRRPWRLPWRPVMHPYLKLAAGLAAVLVVAVVAWQLLPREGGVGGVPTATPTPTATSSPTAIQPMPDGTFAAGTYRLQPLESAPSLTIDAAIPQGWASVGPWAIIGPGLAAHGAPDGVAVAFTAVEGLRSDPCHWDLDGSGAWDQPGDVEVGPTVDDLAAALAASTAYETTTPIDVTLGGFRGKQLDLVLTGDSSGCDPVTGGAEGRYFVFSGADAGGFYAIADATQPQVSIVDVNGTRLIAVLLKSAGTPPAKLSAAQGILDSLVIRP